MWVSSHSTACRVHSDVKGAIRRFLDDDGDELDDADIGGDDESPSKEVNGETKDIKETPAVPLPDVPAASIVGKMDLIFSKKMKSVSINEYYHAGWSEVTPLYRQL